MANTDPGPGAQPGDVFVPSTVGGLGTAFPVVRGSDLLGGLHTVNDLTARNSLLTNRRNEGMLCYVVSTQQTFQLIGGIANVNWVDVTFTLAMVGSFTRPYVAGVMLRDAVYVNGVGAVDRANASALATGIVAGVVTAIDVPALGLAQVVNSGDVSGYVGLTNGQQYVLSTLPGGIVAASDTLNPNYPNLTPGSGNVLYRVGIAGNGGTNLSVSLQNVLVA